MPIKPKPTTFKAFELVTTRPNELARLLNVHYNTVNNHIKHRFPGKKLAQLMPEQFEELVQGIKDNTWQKPPEDLAECSMMVFRSSVRLWSAVERVIIACGGHWEKIKEQFSTHQINIILSMVKEPEVIKNMDLGQEVIKLADAIEQKDYMLHIAQTKKAE